MGPDQPERGRGRPLEGAGLARSADVPAPATKTDPGLLQPPLDVAARYAYVVATKATDLMWIGA